MKDCLLNLILKDLEYSSTKKMIIYRDNDVYTTTIINNFVEIKKNGLQIYNEQFDTLKMKKHNNKTQ